MEPPLLLGAIRSSSWTIRKRSSSLTSWKRLGFDDGVRGAVVWGCLACSVVMVSLLSRPGTKAFVRSGDSWATLVALLSHQARKAFKKHHLILRISGSARFRDRRRRPSGTTPRMIKPQQQSHKCLGHAGHDALLPDCQQFRSLVAKPFQPGVVRPLFFHHLHGLVVPLSRLAEVP